MDPPPLENHRAFKQAFNAGLIIGPPAYHHLNWCPALLIGINFLMNTGTDHVQ